MALSFKPAGRPGWLALAVLALAAIAARPGAAAVDRWALDPARTHIVFSVDALGQGRAQGEFHDFDGRIAIDFENPAQSRVSFRVRAQSIDAGSDALSNYLRGEAFFNAARFAEVAFVSTKVEKIDDKTVRVAGDLTMLGITRPLMVDVEISRQSGDANAGFDVKAHTIINRLDYGMSTGYPLISGDVDLVVISAVSGR